jgi:hypothetical protein
MARRRLHREKRGALPTSDARAPKGGAAPDTLWQRERVDLVLLVLTAVTIPLAWLALLGWSPGRCISGHDAVAQVLLVVQELVASGGDWSALAYRPDLFGGLAVRDAIGPFPPFSLFARLGLAATDAYNLSAWLVQGLLAFLGVRAASDLASSWGESGRRLGWAERLAGVLLVGFAPALGWRFGYGHLNLLVGLMPFAAGLALVVASARRTTTVTLVGVALLALTNGLLFTGHQMVVYGATLGTPILVGTWWSLGRRPRAWVLPVGVGLVALLLALPSLAGVVAYATSSDSPRSLGRTSVVFSYGTERWVDWLASLAWTQRAIPGGQQQLLHHETNLPLGPWLLLLAIVPWRRARGLGVGLAVSTAAIVALGSNMRPISTLLLTLVPPLASFRVPARGALLLAIVVPIVVLGAIGSWARPRIWRSVLLGTLGFIVLFFVPSLAREVLAWLVVAAAVAGRFGWERLRLLLAPGLALMLAGGALGSFAERLLPFTDVEELLARCHRLGRAVETARPELDAPLTRVSLAFEFPELGPNTAFASGLSSLDGYYYPPRRFGQLYWALQGQAYEPGSVLLRTPPGTPCGTALFQLFNVSTVVAAGDGGQLEARPRTPTAGAAWFSAEIRRTPSVKTLAQELLAEGGNLHARAHEVVWVVEDDGRIPASLPASLAGKCASARVLSVEAVRARPSIDVAFDSPGDCPLTLAMNYAEGLSAEVAIDGPPRPAASWPAYGTLMAVLVPRGTGRLRIEAH